MAEAGRDWIAQEEGLKGEEGEERGRVAASNNGDLSKRNEGSDRSLDCGKDSVELKRIGMALRKAKSICGGSKENL